MSEFQLKTVEKPLRDALRTAKRLGAESAKITFSHSESDSVSFEAGRLKEVGVRERESYSIHALVNGRVGVASGNRMDRLEAMTQRAVELATVGSAAHFERWPGPADHVEAKTHSDSVETLDRGRFIQACQQITDRLKQLDSDLFICCSGGKSTSEQLLLTSEGIFQAAKRSSWSLSGMAQRTRGTDMLFAHDGRFWGSDNDYFAPDPISERIERDLAFAERTVEAPKGNAPVILDSRLFSRFLASCVFSGTNGRNVAKGDSPLRGRLDEQVLDPALTIIDDPHIDFCPTSGGLDADGVPTRKQTMFVNGVLKRFLYDLDSAGLAGTEPTGNDGCAPHRVVVTPGTISLEAMIADTDDGVLISDLLGFGQSNIVNGDFSSNIALGFRVKNGEITGRVKDCMVSGNIYDMLKDGVTVSSETDFTGHVPFVSVNGATLSAK